MEIKQDKIKISEQELVCFFYFCFYGNREVEGKLRYFLEGDCCSVKILRFGVRLFVMKDINQLCVLKK